MQETKTYSISLKEQVDQMQQGLERAVGTVRQIVEPQSASRIRVITLTQGITQWEDCEHGEESLWERRRQRP